MVVVNNLVEKLIELGVGAVRSSINTDSGIKIFHSGENAGFETDSRVILLVLVLFPNFFGQIFGER